MYLTHFNLETDPFSLNPKVTHEYWPSDRDGAYKAAIKAVRSAIGPVVITGPSGIGKTFLANKIRSQYPNLTWVRLVATHLSRVEFTTTIAKSVGMHCYEPESHLTQKRRLFSHLLAMTKTHGPVLVEVEETHRFDPDLLLEIAELAKWNIHGQTLITFVLIGQERLASLINLPPLAELKSQVSAHLRLNSLNSDQIGDYLSHRMNSSGNTEDVFQTSAVLAIQEFSSGVIFRINTLAKASIIEASLRNESQIDEAIVVAAANQLGMVRYQSLSAQPPGKIRNFFDRLLRTNNATSLDIVSHQSVWTANDPALDTAHLKTSQLETK